MSNNNFLFTPVGQMPITGAPTFSSTLTPGFGSNNPIGTYSTPNNLLGGNTVHVPTYIDPLTGQKVMGYSYDTK